MALNAEPAPPALSLPHAVFKGIPAHPTHLLVRFKAGTAEADRQTAVQTQGLTVIHTDPLLPGFAVLDTTNSVSLAQTTEAEAQQRGEALARQITALMASGRFDYVEPDYIVQINLAPTDDAFVDGRLWGLENTGQDDGTPRVDIDAGPAWEITTGDTNVIVAIVDTGIRYTHQDLAAQMWHNPGEIPGNGIDDDADGLVDDVYGMDAINDSGDPADQNGHGSHVAGTIGAQANGGGPHVGVAWHVQLMACRFLSAQGGGTMSDAIKCISFAIRKGARVISASWGSKGRSEALQDSIAQARAAGILFVAAAGNDGVNTDVTPYYPCGYDLDNVVSVAALDRTGSLAGFSNYGQNSVDLAAPGVSIFSCIKDADDAYRYLDGTSMATPHVSGAAALLFAQYPQATYAEVKERLLRGAVPMSSHYQRSQTSGRLNAHHALALQFSGPPVLLEPPVSVSAPLGESAAFGVVADGAPPLSYQWSFNGEALSGATNAVLGFEEIGEANAGAYTVSVSNREGTRQSAEATLTLLPALPITTFAGALGLAGHADGTGRAARFTKPLGVAADASGNLYVADLGNHVIRKLTPGRVVTTFAGSPGVSGSADGSGGAAQFNQPAGVAVGADGTVYVADYGNSTIRKITPGGLVTTLAGAAQITGDADGPAASARFKLPRGVAVGADGTVYVADSDNHTIRKITAAGGVSTLAGAAGQPGSVDGPGSLARFNLPAALALDATGNLYVADALNQTIRKITPSGEVSTLAGQAGSGGSADGKGIEARFSSPQGIAVDAEGTLFVADTGNQTIRRVATDGTTTTVAGQAGRAGSRNGDWGERVFNTPRGMAVSPAGDLFVGDYDNHAVRLIALPFRAPVILRQPQEQVVTVGDLAHLAVTASGSAPLRFQWLKDETEIAGATNAVLELTVAAGDAGGYRVRVSNAQDSVTSAVAQLTVLSYHPPDLTTQSPADGASGVAPDVPIAFVIRNRDIAVDPASIRLWFNDAEVTGQAQIAAGPDSIAVNYQPPLLQGATTYEVRVTFADNTAAPRTFSRTWRFATVNMPVIPPAYRTAPGTGLEPGFNVRSVQSAPGVGRWNTVTAAEEQLGNPPWPPLYFSGVATPASINFSESGAARGNFTSANGHQDQNMRNAGLLSPDSSDWVSFEITTYLELDAGVHRFGVNSDDGFRLTAGPTTELNENLVLGVWDAGRYSQDSQFDFYVVEPGLYAFRLIWFQGVLNADVEWFSVDRASGVRTLINDTNLVGAVPAFRDRSAIPDGVAAPYVFVTLAGLASSGSADGVGRNAQFLGPQGLVLDSAGNLYVADTLNHTIRKVTPQAEVTTLAGSPGQAGGVDGVGANARFNNPTSLAVDSQGTVFVADKQNHCIRRLAPDGTAITWAGKTGQLGSTDGTRDAARFFWPQSLAIDATGTLYVTDSGNFTVRKITPDGEVSTLAGLARNNGYVDATGSTARFSWLSGIAVESDGTVFVGDAGNRVIRKVTADGQVTTFTSWTNLVNNDGIGVVFNGFNGLTPASDGSLFVTGGNRVWKVSPDASVRPFAGEKNGTQGNADGVGSAASFNNACAIAQDASGFLYVADANNHTIRRISPAREVSVFAGTGVGSDDGTGSDARFNHPEELTLDAAGNVFVADKGNQTIRKITPDGVVTTVAGKAGEAGWTDGARSAARFFGPNSVAVDGAGNLYVTESITSKVRRVATNGVVTTLAGSFMGDGDGQGTAAKFNQPDSIALSSEGVFYVADFGGHRIRRVTPGGMVTTLAGGTPGFADGFGSEAQFHFPQGVAVDAAGTVYVADSVNFAIRAITPGGLVSTLAGGHIGDNDGVGTTARFRTPTAVAVDAAGNVFVADTGGDTIRRVRPSGEVTTVAGLAENTGSTDGPGRLARFSGPKGVAVSPDGWLFVADTENSTIRVGIPDYSPPAITRQPESLATSGEGVTFQAAALSARPVTWLWRKDGQVLAGETNSTLHLDSVGKADQGTYSAVAVNAYGTAVSRAALLTLLSPPEITRQPEDQSVIAGTDVAFAIEATGTSPLIYQWQHAGTNLPNAQAATLALPEVSPLAAGDYVVTVTNAYGSATSQSARLIVNLPPAITTPPAGQIVAVNADVTLFVVAEGTGPLTYQWSRDGAPLPGATLPRLNLTAVQVADSAAYSVEVSSPYGHVAASADLSVLIPPTIATPPASQAVLEGETAQFTVAVQGSGPFSYQWTHEQVPLPAATNATLLRANVQAGDAGPYSVAVKNPVGRAESAPVLLTVNFLPRITRQPQGLTVMLGQIASLTVGASGTEPLHYQWLKDATNLVNATNAVLSLADVSTNDAGAYSVVVANLFGSTNSVTAQLAVLCPPVITSQPQDLAVLAGTPVTFLASAEGSLPLFYQWQRDGSALAGATNASLLLPVAEFSDAGAYQLVVTNSAGAATSTVARLTVNLPPSITAQPEDLAVLEGTEAVFEVAASGTPPLAYQWSKDGAKLAAETNAVLSIVNVSSEDAGLYAVRVANAFGSTHSAAAQLTVNLPPSVTTQPQSATVIVGQSAAFSVVADGTEPLNYQWSKDATNLVAATNAVLTIASVTTNDAGLYTVAVTNPFGGTNSVAATLTVLTPPTITAGPSDQVAVAGQPADFAVSVEGTTPLFYQWQHDAVPLPVATNDTLHLTGVTPADAGTYQVTVTNSVGAATSVVARLTVNLPPTIARQPADQTVPVGTEVPFTVLAEGTPPLSYQWHRNGSPLVGETNSLLVLQALRRASGGAVRVTVTSPYGVTSSSNATLRVLVPQRLQPPEPIPGGLRLRFRDDDGNLADDLGHFELQGRSAFAPVDNWQNLGLTPHFQDGFGTFDDLTATNQVRRFYRILER